MLYVQDAIITKAISISSSDSDDTDPDRASCPLFCCGAAQLTLAPRKLVCTSCTLMYDGHCCAVAVAYG